MLSSHPKNESAGGYRLCRGGLVTGDHHHGRFLVAPTSFIPLQAGACFFQISSAKKSVLSTGSRAASVAKSLASASRWVLRAESRRMRASELFTAERCSWQASLAIPLCYWARDTGRQGKLGHILFAMAISFHPGGILRRYCVCSTPQTLRFQQYAICIPFQPYSNHRKLRFTKTLVQTSFCDKRTSASRHRWKAHTARCVYHLVRMYTSPFFSSTT